MRARERVCGLRTDGNPGGLVLPVVVADGSHFQPWLEEVQALRFQGVLTGSSAFRNSAAYVDVFLPLIQRLCEDVERALPNAPGWAEFPEAELTDTRDETPFPLPRFGGAKEPT